MLPRHPMNSRLLTHASSEDRLQSFLNELIALCQRYQVASARVTQQIHIPPNYNYQVGVGETFDLIVSIVAAFYRVETSLLYTNSRRQEVCRPRFVAMYFCRAFTDCSSTVIGRHFHRDHTLILHAKNLVENECATNKRYAEKIEELRATIKAAMADQSAISNLKSAIK